MNAGIQKQFHEALLVLALNPEEQVRVTEPGIVSDDIYEDALTWSGQFLAAPSTPLDSNIINAISGLIAGLEEMPTQVFELTNLESMHHPAWEPLRQQARLVLKMLDWPLNAVEPYSYLGKGIFNRAQDF